MSAIIFLYAFLAIVALIIIYGWAFMMLCLIAQKVHYREFFNTKYFIYKNEKSIYGSMKFKSLHNANIEKREAGWNFFERMVFDLFIG